MHQHKLIDATTARLTDETWHQAVVKLSSNSVVHSDIIDATDVLSSWASGVVVDAGRVFWHANLVIDTLAHDEACEKVDYGQVREAR